MNIRKASLAVFRNGKVLLARTAKNTEIFYTLGGKIEAGESDLEAIKREVMEETGTDIDPSSIRFLKEFDAPAHGKPGVTVHIRLYTGNLTGEPVPSREVVEFRYFDSTIHRRHLTPASVQIFAWLKAQGYIS